MIKYLKMKKKETEVKLMLFELITKNKEFFELAIRLVDSCKGLTGDDLRKEFIHELTSTIHNEKNESAS